LNSGQRTDTLLGKILRIDVESGAATYAIPPDNPFRGVAGGGRSGPWVCGTLGASPSIGNGDLYVGDVGRGHSRRSTSSLPATTWDETTAGTSWRRQLLSPGTVGCDQTGLALPVFAYDHSLGCSVTGGYVYRGAAFPPCRGSISSGLLQRPHLGAEEERRCLGQRAPPLSRLEHQHVREDEEGNVYVANHANGDLGMVVVP